MKNQNECSKYLNHSNKFNIVDNSDLNTNMNLINRQNLNGFNSHSYSGASNFHLKSFHENNCNVTNEQFHYDYNSLHFTSQKNFTKKMQNCKYIPN